MDKAYRFRRSMATLLVALQLAWMAPGVQAANHTVEIRNFAFDPANLTIDVGDTVTWVNRDTMQHTSTSGVNAVPDGKWDSGLLNFDQSFPRTFDTPGPNPYFCVPHPFMVGSITVREATPPPPPPLTISITSPANQSSFPAPGDVTIEATVGAEGATVSKVAFFAGRRALGEVTEPPYRITVPLDAGTHSLSAQVTTSTGATAASDVVMVTVAEAAGGTQIDDPFPARLTKGDVTIELEPVAEGLISPLGLAAPDDGSGRLFIYDQAGLVYLLSNGTRAENPVLDVRSRLVELNNYDERGLLGLVTHPNFAENPLLYTYTSEPVEGQADFTTSLPDGATNNHQSVIAEWRLDSADTNRVDMASRREILRIDQPQGNHNGGTLRFGPDGLLYVSLGDGGSADDQGDGHSAMGNGQDIENIWGNVIRIDVDGRTAANGQYAIPADNPFVGQAGLDEIYAYGFRNPYSFSFDRLTGELFLADVGQNEVEEIDRVFRGGNYGWPIKEGSFYFDPNGTERGFITTMPVRDVPSNLADPIAEYDHDEGLAVVGGFVYRGTQLPGLVGRYVTGDWGSFDEPTGRLFYVDHTEVKELRIGFDDRRLGLWLKGYGEDADGELYICASTDLGPRGSSGRVLKLVPAPRLEITSITPQGTNVSLNWNGGAGPFAVQSQPTIARDAWTTVSYATERNASFPVDKEAAFFRVAPATGNPPLPFTVHLSGANERPDPVESPATGSGTLSLHGNTLHIDIHYAGLTGAATAAHIHGPAPASGAAGVAIDLEPFNGGAFGTEGSFSGSVLLDPEEKAMLLAGLTYVNVHTSMHGGGEIRGQIVPVAFGATLSGAAERPQPVESPGSGGGQFFLTGNELSFNISYRDLTGTATAAHIHGPASSEEAAGILIDLEPHAIGGFGASGTFAGTVTLTPEQFSHLVEGRTYVNIHTAAHGGGEIRGQIVPQPTSVPLSTVLSGAAERPNPVETQGTGRGYLALSGNRLHFQVSYAGLSGPATAAHIHGVARASEAAGVMIDLEPFAEGGLGSSGTFSGSVLLSDPQRAAVLQGLTYVNVHTAANGGGEIRGQITPVLLHSVLLGASERPAAVHTPGNGTGHFLLLGDQLRLNVTYHDLTAAATAAHIHGPASPGEAADVMIDLAPFNGGGFGNGGSFAGTTPLTPAQLAALLDGLTYVNVHTSSHPGGEIRGQIVR